MSVLYISTFCIVSPIGIGIGMALTDPNQVNNARRFPLKAPSRAYIPPYSEINWKKRRGKFIVYYIRSYLIRLNWVLCSPRGVVNFNVMHRELGASLPPFFHPIMISPPPPPSESLCTPLNFGLTFRHETTSNIFLLKKLKYCPSVYNKCTRIVNNKDTLQITLKH